MDIKLKWQSKKLICYTLKYFYTSIKNEAPFTYVVLNKITLDNFLFSQQCNITLTRMFIYLKYGGFFQIIVDCNFKHFCFVFISKCHTKNLDILLLKPYYYKWIKTFNIFKANNKNTFLYSCVHKTVQYICTNFTSVLVYSDTKHSDITVCC